MTTKAEVERAALALPGARQAVFSGWPALPTTDANPVGHGPATPITGFRDIRHAKGRVWLARDGEDAEGAGQYVFPAFALGHPCGSWTVDFDERPAKHEAQLVAFERLVSRAAARDEVIRLREVLEAEHASLRHHARHLQDLQGQLDITEQIARTGSFRWNPKDGRQIWTRMNYHLHGYEPSDGSPSFELCMERMHPEDRESFQATVDAGLEAGAPIEVEYRLVMPDGHLRYALARARPDSAGDWIGTVVDVTELRATEDALQATQSALAKALRNTTLGELAAAIAHEVNQPLTSIVANAGAASRWLSREPPNLERAAASLKKIGQDCRRAGNVMRGLNSLSRPGVADFVPVSIQTVVQGIVRLVRPALARQAVQLELALSGGDDRVTGHVAQLQQVLLNLVSNAVDAMADNQGREKVVTLSTRVEGERRMMLEVADTGSGIDPEAADRLFEAFYSTKTTGMGMGLSICRSIVERHRGAISVRPGVPWGSVFQIALPLSRGRA
jgi:signal transduction histidine kinase